jgi:hypothetical protein
MLLAEDGEGSEMAARGAVLAWCGGHQRHPLAGLRRVDEVLVVEYPTAAVRDPGKPTGGFRFTTGSLAIDEDGPAQRVAAVCECGDGYDLDIDALVELHFGGAPAPTLVASATGVTRTRGHGWWTARTR